MGYADTGSTAATVLFEPQQGRSNEVQQQGCDNLRHLALSATKGLGIELRSRLIEGFWRRFKIEVDSGAYYSTKPNIESYQERFDVNHYLELVRDDGGAVPA